MAAALFGNASNQSKKLVEFRAGKMFMKGKMVHPDLRKGLVYVHQSDDELMHFCWKDRTTGIVEDDLIIFPDDTEFKSVPQCTTGRVFVLKFKSSSRRFFLWMQEPKTDKDDEYSNKVNTYLNNPPARIPAHGGGLNLPDFNNVSNDYDFHNILNNISQQQLMQIMEGMGIGNASSLSNITSSRASTTPSLSSDAMSRPASSTVSRTEPAVDGGPTPAPDVPLSTLIPEASDVGGDVSTISSVVQPAPRQQIQLGDLQNILHNITANSGEANRQVSVNLSEALRPDTIIPILSNSEVQSRLLPLLPDGENLPKTEEELRATIHSPQFNQALTAFGVALQSGQLGPLMGQFGLGDEVVNAAARGDLEAFVRALQLEKEDVEMREEDKDEK